jgi:hypothetical protein
MFYSCKESNTVFHTVKLWTPFRTVTDFKRHLVSSHKDVDKTCIFSGCEWSCVNSNTYQSHLARSHGKTGQATVKPQFIICVGSIILEDDVSGNPEDEDLHDGLDPASTSDSSESEAEEDFSHVDSQIQIRLIENVIALLSVADPDPGSGSFLTPGSGIRNRFFPDPGSRIPDLGSRILRPYF